MPDIANGDAVVGNTYLIPNGYNPDGSSRPMVRCILIALPIPGGQNRIARVRRLDTGEEIPCPIYSLASAAEQPPLHAIDARGRITITNNRMVFEMSPLRHGSDRYGVCEICKVNADSMWIGNIRLRYERGPEMAQRIADATGRPAQSHGYTYHNSPMCSCFAHRSCLERRAASCGVSIDATAIANRVPE